MELRHCGQDKRIFFCPVHNASTPRSLQAFGIRRIGKEANPSQNVPSFAHRNLSIFDLLARFVCSWTTQRGRIQEVVARVASRGVVPCYLYFNTL